MRWLAFGTYDVRRHPRVGVVIEGLRSVGDQVIDVNVPLSLDTAARVAMLRQPWRLPVLAAKLLRCWSLLAVRSWRWRRDSTVDAVLVGYLGHFDVRLARLLFRRTPIVLDHLVSAAGTADDRGLVSAGGLKAKLMRAIDDGALRCADVVVVDTAEHRDALPVPAIDRAVVVPVGAAAAWFAAGAQPLTAEPGSAQRGSAGVGTGRPGSAQSGSAQRGLAGVDSSPSAGRLRAIFVGVFTPLHGTPVLGSALALLAGDDRIEVTMVGTGQDHARCRQLAGANERITWLDWVSSQDLPALVAEHHVALGIFGTTAKARKVVPNKVFQGAAAGCAVVTSDTPPQRSALGDAAIFVEPGNAEALAAALTRLAEDPRRLAALRAGAAARAAQRFAPAAVVAPVRDRVAMLNSLATQAPRESYQ